MRTVLVFFLAAAGQAFAAGYGFDMITPPAPFAQELTQAGLGGKQGGWLRVRGMVDGHRVKPDDARTVEGDRAGLLALRARGIKAVVMLRWDPKSWTGGPRAGGGHRMPLDLREAFERGRWLGSTYGDLVAAWEIDNEPDIDFGPDNPETYAAFLKAVYLGLHSGAKSLELGARGCELGAGNWLARKRGGSVAYDRSSQLTANSSKLATPLVIMAAPALPPGPYFERLWANGLASYTDGFNFHYYGYAEDFSGVYRQFEAAVAELGAGSDELGAKSLELGALSSEAGSSKLTAHSSKLTAQSSPLRAPRTSSREWPVFITEYGYGLLDAEARNSVEGRVRQWQWFASVVQRVHSLRPEGPLAFLVNPYFEAGLNEFGLSQVPRPEFYAGPTVASGAAATQQSGMPVAPPSGALSFSPADFGAQGAQLWMRRIGHPLGSGFASPALAYLWDFAERHPYRPRAWSVTAAAPSAVVVDFIPGADMKQWKSGGGYLLGGAEPRTEGRKRMGGSGRLVLYNFAKEAVAGQWEVVGQGSAQRVVLAAGERRELPVELSVQAERFVGSAWRVVFTPEAGQASRAEWVTRLYPTSEGLEEKRVGGFDFPAAQNRKRSAELLKRPLAVGEPRLVEQGRWLATPGVRVEEVGGLWRFHIDALPAEPLRPAMVELALPEGFKVDREMMLVLERRLKAAQLNPGAGAPRPNGGKQGAMLDVYFRTENGNLYQTWPRLRVTGTWAGYAESLENFTMGFFGRAELPWRFFENKPVALVFFLRAAEVPTVFEVQKARLVRLRAGE